MPTSPMDTVEKLDSLGLQTLTEDGSVPQYRIKTARAGSEIVSHLVQANYSRSVMNRNAQGLCDGNPPIPRTKLARAGQLHRTNVNTMETKALKANALTPYYDLFNSGKYPITVLIPESQFADPKDREVMSRVMSEELERMIRKWRSWHNQWWPMLNDFVYHGKGWFIWPDQETWRFKWIAQDRVLFPDRAPVDMEDWELFGINQDLPIHKLWEKVQGKTVKGWNKKAVIEAIRIASPYHEDADEPMDLQRAINEKSFMMHEGQSSTVKVTNVFVKEFSGKWSKLICHRTDHLDPKKTGSSPASIREGEFLYEGRELYDGPEQIVAPFFFEVNCSYVNELSGMGKDVYGLMDLNNRVFCAKMDGAFMRLGTVVQSRTPEAQQKMGIVQIGSMTVLPAGVDVQQGNILSDIDAASNAAYDIRNIVSSNTGIYHPQPERKEGNPETATQYMGRQQQAAVLSNSAVQRFYDQGDRFDQEFVRRVIICSKLERNGEDVKLAKSWRKRCVERGIPDQIFKVILDAYETVEIAEAYRVAGNGSQMLRQQTILNLMAFMTRFPEDGQENFTEDAIAIFGNQNLVNRYLPAASRQKLPTEHHNMALLENDSLRHGSVVTWEPSQNSVIHAQIHLQFAAEAAKALSQGAPLEEVLATLDAVGAHTAQHLDVLARDPSRKEAVKILTEQWKALAKIADQLRAKLEQETRVKREQQAVAEQAQAVAAGTDPEIQLKKAQQDAKLQLSKEKQNFMLGLKAQQQNQKTQMSQQNMAVTDALSAQKILITAAQQKAKEEAQNQPTKIE